MRIDSHCHIFDSRCMLPWAMAKNRLHGILTGTAFDRQYQDNLRTILTHLRDFLAGWWISRMDMPSILTCLQQQSDRELWIPLTLNVDHGYPGCRPVFPFPKQSRITSRLTLMSQGRILPFYCFDPRSALGKSDPLVNVRQAIEQQGFIGIKMYPSLGFTPCGNQDEELDRICRDLFAYCCEDKHHSAPIPITVHCSWCAGAWSRARPPGGVNPMVYFRNLSSPAYWARILREFPSLKLNLAHFGGLGEWLALCRGHTPHEQWIPLIAELCRRYTNVYTDLAFHSLITTGLAPTYVQHLLAAVQGIEEKILLGSDWYMSRSHCLQAEYWDGFRRHLPAELFARFGEVNPSRFLSSPALHSSFPRYFTRHQQDLCSAARQLCTQQP